MGPKRTSRPQGRSKPKPQNQSQERTPPPSGIGEGDADSAMKQDHNLNLNQNQPTPGTAPEPFIPRNQVEENGNGNVSAEVEENGNFEIGPGGDADPNVTYLPPPPSSPSPNTTMSSTPSAGTFREYVEEEDEGGLGMEGEDVVVAATLNLDPRSQKIQINQSHSPQRSFSSSTPTSSSPASFTTANHSPSASAPEKEEEKENSVTSIKSAPPDLSYSEVAKEVKVEEKREPEVVSKDLEKVAEVDVSGSTVQESDDAVAAPELALPSTVSVLELHNAKVYLIGTAHFSVQSQEDVRTTIRQTQPHAVLLELCPSRRNILHLDEEMLLKEAGDISFAKVMQTLKSSPPDATKLQSLLHLLLLSMSASLTKKLGMAPGGEFRAAVQEANQLPKKATFIFGDRPFNVTLSRAIASLSFPQKLKLAWQFLWSSDDITKEEIEKCKERDLLEKMLTEMTGEFPSITEVFVTERDYFLAHTLFMSARTIAEHSEQSGDGPIIVVGVVGMGHVPGICRNFGKTREDEFLRVGSLPPSKPPSTAVLLLKTSVKLAFYGAALYGAYKVFNRFDVFKKVNLQGVKFGFVKVK